MRSSFAIALGASQGVLNTTLSVAHAVTYPGSPGLFQGTVTIGSFGVKSASWSIPHAPTVNLTPSSADLAWLHTRITETLCGHPLANDWAASLTSEGVVFLIESSGVEVTVVLDDNSQNTLSGELSTFCQTDVGAGPNIVVTATESRFVLATPDPSLQWLLDHVVVPQVQSQLNSAFSEGFPFAPFPSYPISFSAPKLEVANGALIAYGGVGEATPAPPPSLGWPSNALQMVGTPDTWKLAFAQVIKDKNIGGSGQFGFDLGIFGFSVGYSWGISSAQVVGSSAAQKASVQITIGGGGWMKIKLVIGTIKIPVGITADPVLGVQLNETGGNLQPVINSVGSLHLHLDLPLPPVVKFLAEQIANEIVKALDPVISQALQQIHFDATPIPVVPFGAGVTHGMLTADNVTIVQQPPSGAPSVFGLSGVPVATKVRQS